MVRRKCCISSSGANFPFLVTGFHWEAGDSGSSFYHRLTFLSLCCHVNHPHSKCPWHLPGAVPAPCSLRSRQHSSCGTTKSSVDHPSLPLYFMKVGELSMLPSWAGELCLGKRPGGDHILQILGMTHLCSAGSSAFAL